MFDRIGFCRKFHPGPFCRCENTGEAVWREKEKLALAWLEEALAGKPERLTSDAWLGVGIK